MIRPRSTEPLALTRRRPPRTMPVLLAYEHPDNPEQWWAWCPFCARPHDHGAAEGHRWAHCSVSDSPFHSTGYWLRWAGRAGGQPVQPAPDTDGRTA